MIGRRSIAFLFPMLLAFPALSGPSAVLDFPEHGFSWAIPRDWFWGADSADEYFGVNLNHWNKADFSPLFQMTFYRVQAEARQLAQADSAYCRLRGGTAKSLIEPVRFLGDTAFRNVYTFSYNGNAYHSESYFLKKGGELREFKILGDPEDIVARRTYYDSIISGIRYTNTLKAMTESPRIISGRASFQTFDAALLARQEGDMRVLDALGRTLLARKAGTSPSPGDQRRLQGLPVFLIPGSARVQR